MTSTMHALIACNLPLLFTILRPYLDVHVIGKTCTIAQNQLSVKICSSEETTTLDGYCIIACFVGFFSDVHR